MKIYKYAIMVLSITCTFACKKTEFDYRNNNDVPVDSIAKIILKANHYNLLADGRAQIEIKPFLYRGAKLVKVLDDRVKDEWIKYYDINGNEHSRFFTTDDQSLVGDTLKIYAKIKDIVSDTVEFSIKAPIPENEYEEITFPVIFHVVQTKEDIRAFGGKFKAGLIDNYIKRMNYVFSGEVSKNPVGVDTKIRFKAALYDPKGNLLEEPGINRIEVDGSVPSTDKYKNFIMEDDNNLNWPFDKYINIWLITDSDEAYKNFGYQISKYSIPGQIYSGTDMSEKPIGLSFNEVDHNTWKPEPLMSGIIYKLQLMHVYKYSARYRHYNFDLMHYLGIYFGLLPTHKHSSYSYSKDYCDDTFNYNHSSRRYLRNRTPVKSHGNYMFLSENIMDDQVGLHRSISKDQTKRIRWIIENCPGRSAWKSKFAFEGK